MNDEGFRVNRMKFYSFTSLGAKIGSIFSVCWVLPIWIVFIIYHQEIPLWAILLASGFICLFSFSVFVAFYVGLVFDEKKGILTVRVLRKQKAKFSEIKDIRINNRPSVDPRKYCFIEVSLKNGKIIKMLGYTSFTFHKHDVEKSAKIVSEIKKRLQEKGYLKGVLEQVISYEE